MASLLQATTVTKLDSHTYKARFSDEWAIGTVPNGGFVASCFLSVSQKHFCSTLKSYNQPDPFLLHLEFLRRTSVGDAIFKVQDKKLGRRTSTVQITLVQDSSVEEVVGYVTNTNLSSESGVSLATNWSLHPPPPPVDLANLRSNTDTNWGLIKSYPFQNFRKATKNVDIFIPRTSNTPGVAIVDEYLQMKNKEPFRLESLGFAGDMFPQMVETFDKDHEKVPLGKNWYPTLVLNLEVKKALPPEGVDILFVRVQAVQIRNGRMDLQVSIADGSGELLALGHHTALVLNASRNLAGRDAKGGYGECKL